MRTQDKNLPFQIVHRFIALVRLTHRSESARKSSNIMFSDDELVIISHLEQAATDLRCANPESDENRNFVAPLPRAISFTTDAKRLFPLCAIH